MDFTTEDTVDTEVTEENKSVSFEVLEPVARMHDICFSSVTSVSSVSSVVKSPVQNSRDSP